MVRRGTIPEIGAGMWLASQSGCGVAQGPQAPMEGAKEDATREVRARRGQALANQAAPRCLHWHHALSGLI